MVKTVLKRIFAIVGASLAPLVALFYVLLGIRSALAITDAPEIKIIIFLIISFILYFALAFGFTFFGAKVLFSFLNREDNDAPFTALVLCFSGFQFVYNLLTLCFFGSSAAIWLILLFSFISCITLLLNVTGLKKTWVTNVVGVLVAMVTAMTVASAGDGITVAAAIVVTMICFLIGATFALYLIKDGKVEKDGDGKDEK